MMIIAKKGIAILTYPQFTNTKGSHQAFICGVLNTLTKSILFGIAFTLITVAATAQIAKQKAIPGSKKISSELFGLFFEDINYAADGGYMQSWCKTVHLNTALPTSGTGILFLSGNTLHPGFRMARSRWKLISLFIQTILIISS